MRETSRPPFGQLLALHLSNGARLGREYPRRLKLLNWGENKIVQKDPARPDTEPTNDVVRVGEKTVNVLTGNQRRYGFGRVALDFDHNTLPGHTNFEPPPRKVAGYGVPQVVSGSGLFLRDIEYTPAGIEFAGEYYDLSPAPLLDENREVTFLHSAALCPQGAVVGLHFFSADFAPPGAISAAHEPAAAFAEGMLPELKELLCVLFGLEPSVSDDDLLTATKQYVADLGNASGTGGGIAEAFSVDGLAASTEDTIRRAMGLSKERWAASKNFTGRIDRQASSPFDVGRVGGMKQVQ